MKGNYHHLFESGIRFIRDLSSNFRWFWRLHYTGPNLLSSKENKIYFSLQKIKFEFLPLDISQVLSKLYLHSINKCLNLIRRKLLLDLKVNRNFYNHDFVIKQFRKLGFVLNGTRQWKETIFQTEGKIKLGWRVSW